MSERPPWEHCMSCGEEIDDIGLCDACRDSIPCYRIECEDRADLLDDNDRPVCVHHFVEDCDRHSFFPPQPSLAELGIRLLPPLPPTLDL